MPRTDDARLEGKSACRFQRHYRAKKIWRKWLSLETPGTYCGHEAKSREVREREGQCDAQGESGITG